MPINSRQKGKTRELEVVDFLKALGLTARRGQQYAGGEDSPDVVCVEMHDHFHIEVKGDEALNIDKALQQAKRDAKFAQVPLVYHRKNAKKKFPLRHKLKVTLLATDFHMLLELGKLYR